MRIHSLCIDNVRGIEHLELHELPETGVIVIHGDNEQGKSTILDALNAVLNFKHGSRGTKTVGRLVPAHRDASPSVSLTASMGPVTFTIEKTWFRGKSARLTVTSPQRDTFTGEQAEAKLDQLKNDHLDAELLSTLFLRQDDQGGSVDAVGISSLTKALDTASGTEGAPGAEDPGLISAVGAEYARYFTPASGKETGELKVARADVEAAEIEHAEARASATELERYVQAYDRAVEVRERARVELPGALAEEAELAEKVSLAEESAARAGRLREELERAEENLARATQAVEERESLAEAVTAAATELDRRREGLEEATAAATHETTQLAELGKQLKEAQDRHRKAGERLRQARATARLVQSAARMDELKAQLAAVRNLNLRIGDLLEQPLGRQASELDVQAVEEATMEVTLQRRLREQAAAKLHLTSSEATSVSVDGRSLNLAADAEAVAVELLDGTEITIGGVTARYAAGYSDASSGADPVEAAELALKDVLSQLGFQDLADIRAAWNAAREAAEEREALTRERTVLLAGADQDELAAEHVRLGEELADADIPADLGPAVAEELVREAEGEQEAEGEEVTTLDASLTPWRERKATLALTELSTRIEAAEAALALARENLQAAEQKGSTAELAAEIEKAEAARKTTSERLSLAEAEVLAADPTLAKNLHDGAVARVESLREATIGAEKQLAELTGRIDMATGAAERLEKAEAALEAARHRLDSVDRRAQAARLLRDTLHRHRDVVRARYAQPFADQLSRLARTVFGHDVEFTLSEELEVTKRSIGDNTVPLEDLSGGAKEQLAILTRFAIASLVSRESGNGQVPVPVVVDDALGSTDPARLQLMATLFTEMGRNSQVIVLTCVPQRYERVAGRTEYAIEDLKSTGMLL